jgi:putative peptide zinc metalloprotease protein
MRPDLQTSRSRYLGGEQVVVKDPVALKYYRFAEEEYALLQLLDGQSSLEQIRRTFEQRFRPQTIAEREIHAFYCQAYRDALLLSDATGQGEQLRLRHTERRSQAWHDGLANVLCIRFRGFNPDRLLDVLSRWTGWLFSPSAFVVFALAAAGALLLILCGLHEFRSRLPSFQEYFAAQNWVWLAATLAATKILHELGHGIACKRFGGDCHEMGILLLVFTPCLYCNVTDSWTFRDKWRRMAVAAAGVYVELILATAATFVWWFSEPGLVQHLSLSVMLVCSVGTLAFNANPLLRYDGYYVLADALEIPNLRQRASAALRQMLMGGQPPSRDAWLTPPRRVLLATYAVTSAIYQGCLTLSVLWFLIRVFEPYGLKIVGQLVACLALYGLVVRPVWHAAQRLSVPGLVVRTRFRRPIVVSGVLGTACLVALLVPLPAYVRCELRVESADADYVYVDVSGTVEHSHVRPGRRVATNEKLLTLKSLDMEAAAAELTSESRRLAVRLDGLRQRSLTGDSAATAEIKSAQQYLASVNEQLKKRSADLARLTITAPRSGIVFPIRQSPDIGPGLSWASSPLEPISQGAYLPRGTAVCQIGEPRHLQAVLEFDESQWDQIRIGLPVELFLDPFPTRVFRSSIREIATASTLSLPSERREPRRRGLVKESEEGRPRCTCHFDGSDVQPMIGSHGRARIRVGCQTLAQRIWRWWIA